MGNSGQEQTGCLEAQMLGGSASAGYGMEARQFGGLAAWQNLKP